MAAHTRGHEYPHGARARDLSSGWVPRPLSRPRPVAQDGRSGAPAGVTLRATEEKRHAGSRPPRPGSLAEYTAIRRTTARKAGSRRPRRTLLRRRSRRPPLRAAGIAAHVLAVDALAKGRWAARPGRGVPRQASCSSAPALSPIRRSSTCCSLLPMSSGPRVTRAPRGPRPPPRSRPRGTWTRDDPELARLRLEADVALATLYMVLGDFDGAERRLLASRADAAACSKRAVLVLVNALGVTYKLAGRLGRCPALLRRGLRPAAVHAGVGPADFAVFFGNVAGARARTRRRGQRHRVGAARHRPPRVARGRRRARPRRATTYASARSSISPAGSATRRAATSLPRACSRPRSGRTTTRRASCSRTARRWRPTAATSRPPAGSASARTPSCRQRSAPTTLEVARVRRQPGGGGWRSTATIASKRNGPPGRTGRF